SEGQQDIRSWHMKIYMTGMIASSETGVDVRERHFIRSLPRDSSLSRAVIRVPRAHEHISQLRHDCCCAQVVLTVNFPFHQLWQIGRASCRERVYITVTSRI